MPNNCSCRFFSSCLHVPSEIGSFPLGLIPGKSWVKNSPSCSLRSEYFHSNQSIINKGKMGKGRANRMKGETYSQHPVDHHHLYSKQWCTQRNVKKHKSRPRAKHETGRTPSEWPARLPPDSAEDLPHATAEQEVLSKELNSPVWLLSEKGKGFPTRRASLVVVLVAHYWTHMEC